MKAYEVTFVRTQYATVTVKAESCGEAVDEARDLIREGDWEEGEETLYEAGPVEGDDE